MDRRRRRREMNMLHSSPAPSPRKSRGASEAEGAAAPPSTSPPAECRLYMGRAAPAGNPAGRASEASRKLLVGGRATSLSCTVMSSALQEICLSILFYIYSYNKKITNLIYVIYLRIMRGQSAGYIRDEAAYCPRSDWVVLVRFIYYY